MIPLYKLGEVIDTEEFGECKVTDIFCSIVTPAKSQKVYELTLTKDAQIFFVQENEITPI